LSDSALFYGLMMIFKICVMYMSKNC
jgi:hypothetical protein